jgi:hypothetical protein
MTGCIVGDGDVEIRAETQQADASLINQPE